MGEYNRDKQDRGIRFNIAAWQAGARVMGIPASYEVSLYCSCVGGYLIMVARRRHVGAPGKPYAQSACGASSVTAMVR